MKKEIKVALLTIISIFTLVTVASVQNLLLSDKNPFQKQNNFSDDLQANLNHTDLKNDYGQVMGEEDSETENGRITRDGDQEIFYLAINVSGTGSSTPADGYHQYPAGTTVNYTLTANNGSLIDSLKIKGVTIFEASGKATYSGTITMDSDYIIETVFATKTTSHNVQYKSLARYGDDPCGTISGPSSAIFGDMLTFDVTHNDRCYLVSLKYSSPTSGEYILTDTYTYGEQVTFPMPNSDTTVTAVFEPEADCGGYSIIIENGTGSDTCIYEGSERTARPFEIYGKRFVRWTSDDITITDPTNPILTFTTPIPGRDIHIVAVFEDLPKYTVTLNCPPADQLESAGCLNYEPIRFVGETVYFHIRPTLGYYVHKVLKNGETFYGPVDIEPSVDGSYTNNSFIITENLNFSFELKKYLFDLSFGGDGTHGSMIPNVTKAGVGDEVTFTVSPHTGYRLKRAYVAYGADADYTELDITSTLKFTMPAESVTYFAEFEEETESVYNITVNNGIADHAKAPLGAVVRINANEAPEGKEFDKWTSNLPGVFFEDIYNPATTFMMLNQDIVITANYKSKQYIFSFNCGANGECEVIPNQAMYVHGSTVTLNVFANTGYTIEKILKNGIEMPEHAHKETASISITILGDTLVKVTFVNNSGTLPTHPSSGSLVDLSLTASITEQNWNIVTIIRNIDASFVGKKIEIWLNSDPVKIGEFTVVAGKTDYEIIARIPCSIPVGMHTVNLKLGSQSIGNKVSLAVMENGECKADTTQTSNIVNNRSNKDLPTAGMNAKLLLTIVGSLMGLGIFVILSSRKKSKK